MLVGVGLNEVWRMSGAYVVVCTHIVLLVSMLRPLFLGASK